jgi:hypothetical protein
MSKGGQTTQAPSQAPRLTGRLAGFDPTAFAN